MTDGDTNWDIRAQARRGNMSGDLLDSAQVAAKHAMRLLDTADALTLGAALTVLERHLSDPDHVAVVSRAREQVNTVHRACTASWVRSQDVRAALQAIRPTIEPLLLELAWAG